LVDDLASVTAPSFNIVLPSSSTIGDFWPDSQHIIALPHDLQRAITSQLGVIYAGLCILLTLANVAQPEGRASVTPSVLNHYLPWIIDSVQALWKHFRRWTTSPEKRLLHDEITLAYLQLLEALFLPAAAPGDCSSTSLKNAQSLINSLGELLDSLPSAPASEVGQVQLAIIFTRLRNVLTSPCTDVSTIRRRQDTSRAIIVNDVEDIVARACQDAERFSQLHKDLQVRAEHHNILSMLIGFSSPFASGRHQVHGLCTLRTYEKSSARVPLTAFRMLGCLKNRRRP
jgi:serine/threonine-protein kinase ATR